MKNKKIAAFLLTAAVTAGSASACMSTALTGTAPYPGASAITVQAASTPSASTLAKAVKKAYGDQYVPNYKLGSSEIKDKYGVSSSWYASAYAEVPMISAHVDELVIFEAKNASSKKKIAKAVKNYQKKLKEDTTQYPMNLLKIQGCRVYTNGNYVCFIMLGQINSSLEENGTEEEIIKAYQKQNQKAVDVLKKKLK